MEDSKDYIYSNISEYQDYYLAHYGVKRRSGRYPWGSGDTPYQHEAWFLARYDELRAQGLSEKDIAREMGIFTIVKGKETDEPSIKRLRARVSIANYEVDTAKLARIHSLQADGLNTSEIAREMGYKNESSVRSLLQKEKNGKYSQAMNTALFLENTLNEKGWLDVGKYAENSKSLGISRTKMDTALEILKEKGYNVYSVDLEQVTNQGKYTKYQVLTPADVQYKDLWEDGHFKYDKLNSIDDYISYDNGLTFKPSFIYPSSMDSKRIAIRYGEEGGLAKDGLIEIRRGVPDLSLGESSYAQVRILVDGTHYIKGMAVYSDDLPPGKDIIFNTNKKAGTPMMSDDPKAKQVLKPIDTKNPDNPFGSLIKEHGGQSFYDDPNGNYIGDHGQRQSLSLINKRAEEGDWNEWADKLSAQMLSKQKPALIRRQLELSLNEKRMELNEIEANTNPVVKKKLLEDFAGECDTKSVHLDAAALPRQKYQVILPLSTIKDNEIYAPNYKNGEKVALIRYPHGGTFEIPILTVNNYIQEGINTMGKGARDAVGISKKVADQLSGADFDGDTVMVIPTNDKVRISSRDPLKGLEGFDPGEKYPLREGGKVMSEKHKQKQMGVVSNLITDMTLKGASDEELAKAVRHSMVVIDAVKHKYDYKASEIDNDIDNLKRIYQKQPDGSYGGASTLISRAKSETSVDKRQGSPQIQEDGTLYFKPADDLYRPEYKKVPVLDENGKKVRQDRKIVYKTDANGNYIYEPTGRLIKRTQKSTKMAEVSDARDLISDYNTTAERLYADYANGLKDMAKEARSIIFSMNKNNDTIHVNAAAKKEYASEVEHLKAQLYLAESNKPKERKAQAIASSRLSYILRDNPDIKKGSSEYKKISQQEINKARAQVGARRTEIIFTDREWDAIQKGALSANVVSRLLVYAKPDDWKSRSTPKSYTTLSNARVGRLRSMYATGNYSIAELSEAFGVSASTIRNYIKEGS